MNDADFIRAEMRRLLTWGPVIAIGLPLIMLGLGVVL